MDNVRRNFSCKQEQNFQAAAQLNLFLGQANAT